MVNTFTQGNWYVEEDSYSGHCCFSHSIISDIKNVSGFKTQVAEIISSYSEAEADARLIAASPDLLKALKSLVEDENQELIPSYKWQQALKAIAKAEGNKND